MDHGTPEPPTVSAGSLNAEDEFLKELDPTQWKRIGNPAVTTVAREWSDGSVDTLIVLSPDTAYYRRDDPRLGLVKQDRGNAVEMARFVQHLPAPGTPGAPNEEICRPDRADVVSAAMDEPTAALRIGPMVRDIGSRPHPPETPKTCSNECSTGEANRQAPVNVTTHPRLSRPPVTRRSVRSGCGRTDRRDLRAQGEPEDERPSRNWRNTDDRWIAC